MLIMCEFCNACITWGLYIKYLVKRLKKKVLHIPVVAMYASILLQNLTKVGRDWESVEI